MSDAYRNDHEAALRQIEVLQEENQALRDALEEQSTQCPSARAGGSRAKQPPTLPILLAGLFFLAGSVTIAGAIAGREQSGCCHGRQGLFASARAEMRHARQVSEPGSIRVVGLERVDDVLVQIDGVAIPRSGGAAFSGPLTGYQRHQVTITAPGYRSFTSVVQVEPMTVHTIDAQLTAVTHAQEGADPEHSVQWPGQVLGELR